jgi:hypothetical protein
MPRMCQEIFTFWSVAEKEVHEQKETNEQKDSEELKDGEEAEERQNTMIPWEQVSTCGCQSKHHPSVLLY